MRFHDERNKRLNPMGHSQIDAPPSGDEKFVIRRRALLAPRPVNRSQRSESLPRDEEIAERADEVIYVPRVAEHLQPLVAVVPLQLLAYHITAREHNQRWLSPPLDTANSVRIVTNASVMES